MAPENEDIKNVVVIGLIECKKTKSRKYMYVVESDGTIQFPGGKVKINESLYDALRRELDEEVGIKDFARMELVAIEHAAIMERFSCKAKKSMLLYFYNVNLHQDTMPTLQDTEKVNWMDINQLEIEKSKIPYDNYLISRGIQDIEIGKNYIVPEGFRDSQRDPALLGIRTFCWKRQLEIDSPN